MTFIVVERNHTFILAENFTRFLNHCNYTAIIGEQVLRSFKEIK